MRWSGLPFPARPAPWPESLPRSAPERRTGLNFDHDWSRRYPVRLARAIVLDNVARPVARVVAPTTIRGAEHLAHLEPPVIFAANHTSHIDTPLLLTVLPTRLRHRTVVMAASDYFFDRSWKAWWWSFALAAVPIDRTRVNRHSADTAVELLADGWNLVIFPEGGRSPDGWMQPFHPASAAYLARRSGRPVVPIHLGGTRRVLGKTGDTGQDADAGRRPGSAPGGSGTEGREAGRLRRSPVTVTFGAPLRAGHDEDTRHLARRVEQAVVVLAAESRSDWWTARRQQAAGRMPAAGGPEASPWRRAWALDQGKEAPEPSVSRGRQTPDWMQRA